MSETSRIAGYLSNRNYEPCRRDILGWLYLKARATSKASELFVHQLALHASRIGDVHAGQWHHFHSHQILDAVAELEGTARTQSTKPDTPYHGPVLRGLRHKHFMSPAFVLKNIANSLKRNTPELADLVKERFITAQKNGHPIDLDSIVAHTAVIDGFRLHAERAPGEKPRITGECIVFESAPTGNVLLTLATHAESDEVIFDRVQTAKEKLLNIRDLSSFAE